MVPPITVISDKVHVLLSLYLIPSLYISMYVYVYVYVCMCMNMDMDMDLALDMYGLRNISHILTSVCLLFFYIPLSENPRLVCSSWS